MDNTELNLWERSAAIADKVAALDGTQESGINWDWALFPSELNAQMFDQWIRTLGAETRGVCLLTPSNSRYGVRFR